MRVGRKTRGQAILLFALGAVVFFAFLAFVIDWGRLFFTRQKLRNHCDAAALAGTQNLPSFPHAKGAATSYYAKNVSLTDSDVIWQSDNGNTSYYKIGIDDVYVTTPYTDAKLTAAGIPAQNAIEVKACRLIHHYIGALLGAPTARVCARAVAICSGGGGGEGAYVIFANRNTGPKSIDWTGSSYSVTGLVHTNSDIEVSGSGNVLNGSIEYNTTYSSNVTDTGHIATPGGSAVTLTQTATKPYPVNYKIEDYAPGGARAVAAGASYHQVDQNSIKGFITNSVLAPGIYYCDGDMNFSPTGVSAPGVTIAVTGTLQVTGGTGTWSPFSNSDPLFFANGPGAGGIALNVSGSNTSWLGIIFAPTAGINMSGSSNTSINGAVIGYTVKLSGSHLQMTQGNEFFGGGGPCSPGLVE